MHSRMAIRRGAMTALTNTTAAGARIQAMRVEPNIGNGLPALGVYTMSDQVDPESDVEDKHEVKLMIEGWVADSAAVPVADAADNLALQIENAMGVDRSLGGTCGGRGVLLTGTEFVIYDEKADPLVGVITLTYSAVYFAIEGATSPTTDFLRTGATTQIDGATPDNAVSDLINQRP